jgi:hypothetical protein
MNADLGRDPCRENAESRPLALGTCFQSIFVKFLSNRSGLMPPRCAQELLSITLCLGAICYRCGRQLSL